MKILLVSTTAIPVPPPHYGGIERGVYEMAVVFGEQGHDITVVATKGSHPPSDVKLIETVEPGSVWNDDKAFGFYKQRLENFDVVCDSSHMKLASTELSRIKAYIPVSKTLSLPKFPTNTPCLICVSKSHSNIIYEKYGYSSRVIYNGVAMDEFKPLVKWRDKSDRFLFVGRFVPEKGALEATRFCVRLKVPLDLVEGRLPNESFKLSAFRFAMKWGLPVRSVARHFNSGNYPLDYLADVMAACRSQNIAHHPPQPYHVVANYMARAKAFIFPVKYPDLCPRVVIEAAASGTPVIAYKIGALPELVKHSVTGLLVDPDDEEGFVQAMRDIESINPEDCRRYAEENFTMKRMGTQYLDVFADALAGRRW